MAGYGYGYGNFTSQPQQQYAAAASYASQNASFGYAAAQQQPTGAYATTAFAQPQVPVASAGYGYFQRGSDPVAANYLTSQKTSQPYGYGVPASVKTTSYSGTTYQKQNAYNAAASTNFSGYTTQKTATVTPTTSSHQNAYEKVVYNAATTFLTEQAQSSKPTWQKNEKPTFKLNGQGKSWHNRNSGPPKVQQLHYCEVCKISCAGPQTYKEHLDGQKHKKKAAMATTETKNLAPGTYKCELCDVVCTGKDAYNAHVKGASHDKTYKLHQKLGKPIPEIKALESTPEKKITEVKSSTAGKITFVSGEKLGSTGEGKEVEEKPVNNVEDGEIIGETYVEDIKSDAGKIIGYQCTLCDCRFNDEVAKIAHMKGRRHRSSYKKKVDPKIKVDMKRDRRRDRNDRGVNEMAWKQRQHEQMRWEQQLRFREEELRRWEQDEYKKRSSVDRYFTKSDRNRINELEYYEWEGKEKYIIGQQDGIFPHQCTSNQLPDDRIVMMKHKEIYPVELELKKVQFIVASTEKALKLVSDSLEQVKKCPEPLMKQGSNRVLKGVMRVGALAKGLLLKGQLSVELVVLSAGKPTYTLLDQIGKLLPEKLKEIASNEKFEVSLITQECAITVTSVTEVKCTVKVFLTSPSMREGNDDDDDDGKKTEEKKKDKIEPSEPLDPKDVLDKDTALRALAALRHAKWFQARANHLASCVVTIRVIRDLCNRMLAFKPLNDWAIELLCEKSLASCIQSLGPGDAFRRVMEVIASGIFLPGGTGLLDPCEKEKKHSAINMSAQERENITGAAQHALRLQSFRQLNKVLGVEDLEHDPNRPKRSADEINVSNRDSKIAKKY